MQVSKDEIVVLQICPSSVEWMNEWNVSGKCNKLTIVKNSNDQQFYPHTTIKKAKGNESWWLNRLGDPGTMLEKVKGIWTWCQRRLKETGRDVRKDQEIWTRCRSRLKEKGSSLGKYQRTQGNPGTMPEKRSYSGEYQRIQDRWGIKSVRVLKNLRQKGLFLGEYWRRYCI